MDLDQTLIFFVTILGRVLGAALLVRVILSWIKVSPTNPFVVIVNQITDPILVPIRRVLPKTGMFDFSPMIALLLVVVIQEAFVAVLRG